MAAKKRGKALALAQAVISTAEAVTQALTAGPVSGQILAAATAIAGAAEIAIIASQEFAKGGIPNDGTILSGPSHAQGGIPAKTSNGNIISLEGNEAIINTKSTAMYKPLLSAINVAGGGKSFATGGIPSGATQPNFATIASITSTTNDQLRTIGSRELVVSVQEFDRVSNRVRTIERDSSI